MKLDDANFDAPEPVRELPSARQSKEDAGPAKDSDAAESKKQRVWAYVVGKERTPEEAVRNAGYDPKDTEYYLNYSHLKALNVKEGDVILFPGSVDAEASARARRTNYADQRATIRDRKNPLDPNLIELDLPPLSDEAIADLAAADSDIDIAGRRSVAGRRLIAELEAAKPGIAALNAADAATAAREKYIREHAPVVIASGFNIVMPGKYYASVDGMSLNTPADDEPGLDENRATYTAFPGLAVVQMTFDTSTKRVGMVGGIFTEQEHRGNFFHKQEYYLRPLNDHETQLLWQKWQGDALALDPFKSGLINLGLMVGGSLLDIALGPKGPKVVRVPKGTFAGEIIDAEFVDVPEGARTLGPGRQLALPPGLEEGAEAAPGAKGPLSTTTDEAWRSMERSQWAAWERGGGDPTVMGSKTPQPTLIELGEGETITIGDPPPRERLPPVPRSYTSHYDAQLNVVGGTMETAARPKYSFPQAPPGTIRLQSEPQRMVDGKLVPGTPDFSDITASTINPPQLVDGRLVYPKENCGSCVIAAEMTRRGTPASAVPWKIGEAGLRLSEVQRALATGWKFRWLGANVNAVADELLAAGPGSRGVVVGARYKMVNGIRTEMPGHAFNAENVDGNIQLQDVQTGRVDVTEYQGFWFLRLQ